MKILFVNKYHYIKGGPERYIFDLIKVFEEKGHEVIHFSMEDKRNQPSDFAKYFVSHIDFRSSLSFIERAKTVPRIIYFSEAKKKIEQLIEETKPDLAHLHNYYHHLSPSIIHSLKKYKIPIVQTAHDYKLVCPVYIFYSGGRICESCKKRKYYWATLKRCNENSFSQSFLNTCEMYIHNTLMNIYKNIDIFIAPSKFIKEKLIEYHFDEERIVHLPNFIKIDDYIPQYSYNDYIVYFGRISKEKGILNLIKAVKEIPGLKLKIIGEGPIRKKLEDIIVEENIRNVEFLGYMVGEDLKNYIKGSMFVVLPSEWYENNPFTILESFALGKPVIGSNIGGIPELIEEEKDGLLFKIGDKDELKEKITYLVENSHLIEEMGKNARRKIEREYNEEIHYQKLMHIFQMLCSKGG